MFRAIGFSIAAVLLMVTSVHGLDSGDIYRQRVWSIPWITVEYRAKLISWGSGWVLCRQGDHRVYVVTCAHVIEDVPLSSRGETPPNVYISVHFPYPDAAGQPVVDSPENFGDVEKSKVRGAWGTIARTLTGHHGLASVAAIDHLRDLAVLDVAMVAHTPRYIQPIPPGEIPRPGDRLQIIGCPADRPQWRSTLGEFKNMKEFRGRYKDDRFDRQYQSLRFLASSWGGNSGGPVLDKEGMVVGTLSAGNDTEGGFARAVMGIELMPIMRTLMAEGRL